MLGKATVDAISHLVYQAIVAVHQQHPPWLKEPFKHYVWSHQQLQVQFTAKLAQKLRLVGDRDTLIIKLIALLNRLIHPSYFVSYQFNELLIDIRQQFYPELEIEARALGLIKNPSFWGNRLVPSSPFSVLLLDAENLPLDIKLEKFLTKICRYPVKVKLAFANWHSLGRKDIEFHRRGYELLHVPPGKNSADLKMIAVGSSLFLQYPMAKEVFVCSSDGDLNQLCSILQSQGLTVYKVSRQGVKILIFNSQTGKTDIYLLSDAPKIPLLQNLIEQIKGIIRAEQIRTQVAWIKLARVSQLFQANYHLSLSLVIAYHFPGKTVRDFFLGFKQDFVIHQLSDAPQIYITLFEESLAAKNGSSRSSLIQPHLPPQLELQSKADLETALMKIVKSLMLQSSQEYIPIGNLASQFQKHYAMSITSAMKYLQLGSKFTRVLQSCSTLKLKKVDKTYYVSLEKD